MVVRFSYFVGLASLCFAMFLIAPLTADTWTDSTGQHKIEAEFVQLAKGSVQLKRDSDGKLIWVPLDKLSKSDQAKAKSLQSKMDADGEAAEATGERGTDQHQPSDSPEQLAKQIKVKAKVELSKFGKFDDSGNELPRDMSVIVTARGKPAATAIQYGFVKVETLTDGGGGKLEQGKDDMMFEDPSKEFLRIDREGMFSEHPEDGVAVPIPIVRKDGLKKIGEVKGSFKLLTGGQRNEVSIKDFGDKLDKNIDSAELQELGLKVKIAEGDQNGSSMLDVQISGKLEHLVAVKLMNGRKEIESSGWSSSGNLRGVFFELENKNVIQDLTLKVLTVKDAVEVEVPFEASDLKIPTKPPGF